MAKNRAKKIKNRLQNLRESFLKVLKHPRRAYFAIGLIGLVILVFLASRYLVVAWVDNKPITRFEYFKALDQKYGKEVREQLIVEALINAEALKRGLAISNDEIEAEIKKIQDQQGGADKLEQILQVQSISQNEFRKLVRLQLLKQKMFGQDIQISEEDVNKYLETQQEQIALDDKQKQELKEQLKQQKINTNFNEWLKEALNSSRVGRV